MKKYFISILLVVSFAAVFAHPALARQPDAAGSPRVSTAVQAEPTGAWQPEEEHPALARQIAAPAEQSADAQPAAWTKSREPDKAGDSRESTAVHETPSGAWQPDAAPGLLPAASQSAATPNLSDPELEHWNAARISLVTIGPDSPVYSRFGHTGLLVEEHGKPSLLYDWGRFSFAGSLVFDFAKGVLWYEGGVSYAPAAISWYIERNRSVSIVELSLSAQQKAGIAAYVQESVREENRVYLYDYYMNNCATKIRDIIARNAAPEFEAWSHSTEDFTFRHYLNRNISGNYFWWLTINLVSGPFCEKPRDRWDAMFLPDVVERSVLEFDGPPLALKRTILHQSTRKPLTDHSVRNTAITAAASLSISLLCLFSLHGASKCAKDIRRKMVAYKTVTISFDLFFGAIGTFLLYAMLFSAHQVAYGNENIALFNPLLIAAAVLSFHLEKHQKSLLAIYRILLAASALLFALKIILPGVFFQDNLAFIILAAPYYAANAVALKNMKTESESRQKPNRESAS